MCSCSLRFGGATDAGAMAPAKPQDPKADVLLEVDGDGVATLTLNRARQRNALSANLQRRLKELHNECEAREDVKCVIITGAGAAFCAGIDLKEFASGKKGGVDPRARKTQARSAPSPAARAGGAEASNAAPSSSTPNEAGPATRASVQADVPRARPGWIFHGKKKLLIGAVNGPAVTGGLELALNCDFLIASTKATFSDTHARVGVMPGGGLTVLLPQWIGVPRARQMSVTGDYVDAAKALAWGLVNEVVEPADLLPRAKAIARTAAGIEATPQLLATYAATTRGTVEEGWQAETRLKYAYAEADGKEVGRRYEKIRSRGAEQQRSRL